MTKVLTIFGLSGVGKSTLIKGLCDKDGSFLHLQAGTLIKEGLHNEEVSRDALRLKNVDGIDDNQKILIAQFRRTVQENQGRNIVFDGHLVIDTDKELVKIPFNIISSLLPSALITVVANPASILTRRLYDGSRKRPTRTVEEISAQQDISCTLGREYAANMKVPYLEVSNENTLEAVSKIHSFLEMKHL